MRRRFKIVIVVLIGIAVLVTSILVYASATNTHFFSRDLQVTDFVVNGDGEYTANISDSGVLVGGLDFRIEHSVANLTSHRIQFSIWHTDSSQLDSMTLRFSTEPYVINLYLEASSYDWPGARFTRGNNLDVVYSVPNIGWYGSGTVTLDFILDSWEQAPSLWFTADFSMHMNSFLQLTSLKANAHLYTPIPD